MFHGPTPTTGALQVAVVDSVNRVVVYDLLSKEVVFQESGATRYVSYITVCRKNVPRIAT